MPSGKGTYGCKLGRPSRKGAMSSAAKRYKRDKRVKEVKKELLETPLKRRKDSLQVLKQKHQGKKLIKMSKGAEKTNKVEPGYKKAHDYIKKSSATLDSGGYKEEAIKVNDARDRSKKS